MIYTFNDPERVASLKENLGLRHPSDRTEWLDPYTVRFDGKVDTQLQKVCRLYGGKLIEGD